MRCRQQLANALRESVQRRTVHFSASVVVEIGDGSFCRKLP